MREQKWWEKLICFVLRIKVMKPVIVPDSKPVSTSCGCDLSTPVCEPPYTGEQLSAAGNSEECPTIAGRDVRFSVSRPDNKGSWLIGSLMRGHVTFNGDQVNCPCFTEDGYRYHIKGWAHNSATKIQGDKLPCKYVTTTFIFSECRKVVAK